MRGGGGEGEEGRGELCIYMYIYICLCVYMCVCMHVCVHVSKCGSKGLKMSAALFYMGVNFLCIFHRIMSYSAGEKIWKDR